MHKQSFILFVHFEVQYLETRKFLEKMIEYLFIKGSLKRVEFNLILALLLEAANITLTLNT